MTTEAMEHALSQLPERSSSLLTAAKPHLLVAAQDINEQILGIICASPSTRGNSALVITSRRIVEVTTGGGLQVLPFSEVSGIQCVGGKKKFLGGHEALYLRVLSPDGGIRTYPIFGDHDWNSRMGKAAEAAWQRSRIQST